jgi:hypothetical protein
MATVADVRRCARPLPRVEEYVLRDHLKYRVGRLVFLSVSPDETLLGFGYPREERAALVASDPDRFLMPARSDQRYNWASARLALLDPDELHELVLAAWRMVVPKRLAAEFLGLPR